jgi:hypothetical protein
VLLSDGTSSVGGDPIEAADRAKTAGTRIFTIGFGDDVDRDTLCAIASSWDAQDDCFFEPITSDLLAGIYDEIVKPVPCWTLTPTVTPTSTPIPTDTPMVTPTDT